MCSHVNERRCNLTCLSLDSVFWSLQRSSSKGCILCELPENGKAKLPVSGEAHRPWRIRKPGYLRPKANFFGAISLKRACFSPQVYRESCSLVILAYPKCEFGIVRIVLDTCVLVSAARSRNGASFRLVSALPERDFEIALTVALYTEWQDVMTRPEHLPPGVTPDAALALLRYLASLAHLQDVHFLWRPFLRDTDDDMVLECAVASGSETIVSHNVKDFKRAISLNVRAITPAQFLAEQGMTK